MERKKWQNDNLPKGYPTKCDTKQLNEVIQDLSEELYQKTQNGKINGIWRFQVTTLIKSGRDELKQRTQIDKKEATWFSMNNPIIYFVVVLVITIIIYIIKL